MNLKLSLYTFWAAAVMMTAVGCGEKPQPGPEPGPDPYAEPVTLSLTSTLDTKTVMGPLSNGVYPVFWTDGDRVCVNGVKSSTLFGLEAPASSADFTIEGVQPPYHIVYPSIDCQKMSADGVASLRVPTTQSYVPDSFCSGAAILYGSTEDTYAELKNISGIVRIPLVKGSSYGGLVNSVTLSSRSGDYPLSGDFTLDTKDGSLCATQAQTNVLLALPAEGVTLGSEPKYFCIAIPGGEYPDGFDILLDSAEGTMLCSWDAQTEVPAGVVITLGQIAFKPNNTKLIDSIDSWNEFALAMNSGDYERWVNPDTGEASIVADISYGGDLTIIETIPEGFTLNGGGHIIRRANATEALIMLVELGGVVKNLTVGGTRVAPSAVADRGTGNIAAFCRGTLENCVNEMNVTLTDVDSDLVFSGLVTDNCGVLKDCKNKGDISLSFKLTASRKVYGGGIAARCHRNKNGIKYSGQFINCENSGAITIKRAATGIYNFQKYAVGGIAACVEQGAQGDVHASFINCTNSGSITSWQDANHTNANWGYAVGGILGRNCLLSSTADHYYIIGGCNTTAHDGYYVYMENCTNTGVIDASLYSQAVSPSVSYARQAFVGGIVGALQSNWDPSQWSVLKNCVSKGDVRTGNLVSTDLAGGIAGGIGYANVENCIVDVTIGRSRTNMASSLYMGAAGGAFGSVLRDVNIKDCDVTLRYSKEGANSKGAGFVGYVAKNDNLSANVATKGYATLNLLGNNYFSGTIESEAVTAANVTIPESAGLVTGNITIK